MKKLYILSMLDYGKISGENAAEGYEIWAGKGKEGRKYIKTKPKEESLEAIGLFRIVRIKRQC